MKFTLALDLEDTLITPLVRANLYMMHPGPFHPRPGLREFLVWAGERFDLVVFTGVPEPMAAKVLSRLVEDGHVPEAFGRVAIHLAMDARGRTRPPKRAGDLDERLKDLTRLGPVGAVLMLDDNPEGYCVSGQEAFWIKIPEIPRKMGTPTGDEDLARAREMIERAAASMEAGETPLVTWGGRGLGGW